MALQSLLQIYRGLLKNLAEATVSTEGLLAWTIDSQELFVSNNATYNRLAPGNKVWYIQQTSPPSLIGVLLREQVQVSGGSTLIGDFVIDTTNGTTYLLVAYANKVWAAGTEYALGDTIIDFNGNLQTITISGISGSEEPSWSTVSTTNDGELTWSASAGFVTIANSNGSLVSATGVLYDYSGYSTVELALNYLMSEVGELTYQEIQIVFTNDQGYVEIGTQISEVTLSWTINKTVVSQSINQGIGTILLTIRTYQVTYPSPNFLTTNLTWTLTATDGTKSVEATTAIMFLPKVYWGVSANTILTNSDILSFNSALASSFSRAMTYNCTGGSYPYYCYPVSFGLPNSVIVGGLSMSAYTVITQEVTNSHGYSQSYYIINFNYIQTSNSIPVTFQ